MGALATYLLWDMQSAGPHDEHGAAAVVDARQTVEAFIVERGLERTELARLLAEHFDGKQAVRSRVRHHVIERFAQVWYEEAGNDPQAAS